MYMPYVCRVYDGYVCECGTPQLWREQCRVAYLLHDFEDDIGKLLRMISAGPHPEQAQQEHVQILSAACKLIFS